MFKCLSCGERFNKPRIVKEMHYELSPPVPEVFAVCPVCSEGDIAQAGYIQFGVFRLHNDIWREGMIQV